MSTESTITHHVKALADGDLEEVMADYSRRKRVHLQRQHDRGHGRHPPGVPGRPGQWGIQSRPHHEVYHGDVGYITWSVPGIITLGTDTFVVRDDVIVMQTSAVAMAG